VSVAQHAADAAALLQYLEIDQAHVVGHSSGAAVAVELAIEHPGAVQTIALLELSLLALPKGQEFLGGAAPVMDLYAAGRNEEAFAAFMSAVSGLAWEDCRTLLEARIPGLVEQSVADADTFFGVELPALADWSLHQERAGRIEQPVLSVIGTETQPLWFEVAEFLRCHVPRIEEARISGAGHLLHIQEPDAVTDAVASFLEGHRIGQP
jgi:3-oxoadipate enol-lactonase